jgi:hypothetical protein
MRRFYDAAAILKSFSPLRGKLSWTAFVDAHKPGCDWDVALNVRLADPADAGKMKKGRLVRLGGKFLLTRRQQSGYLAVENAKIEFVDYFWSLRPSFARAAPASGPNIAPFYTARAPSMPAGNSALAFRSGRWPG